MGFPRAVSIPVPTEAEFQAANFSRRLLKPLRFVCSRRLIVLPILLVCSFSLRAQQPAEPVNQTPLNGETYYLINQSDDLQMDLNADSTSQAAPILQQTASYTSLSQRWALTSFDNGLWQISNVMNGLCLDTAASGGPSSPVQNSCVAIGVSNASQEWLLTPTSNGYYTIKNQSSGLLLSAPSTTAGAQLGESALSGPATQSQQWLLRPAFFRGVDGALLEKQEAARVSQSLTWWKDAGTATDLLQLFKNHGVNMVRLRPTSMPPYATQPSTGACVAPSPNLCYAETDAQDLDLAKRAKNLGMSVELTLLFDGASSNSIPAAWASLTPTQLQAAIYAYVKQEIESYRSAGVMPDLVAIGNEVDTGFLGSANSPTGSTAASFAPFAALQTQAIQAVKDAASDTSIGAAIPAPLTCIHITPAWNLTNFFTLANESGITYDAICQSYYPLYHGPLTAAQAATSNPSNQPIEQSVLNAAQSAIGKPIFIIETGEHYENGFDSNDPWYPPSEANQRQFLIDLDSVLRAVPTNLAMGMEYWDPEGVNIPNPSGGFLNGDNQPNAVYTWNGLTIFNNADTSGTTSVSDPTYSALLPAADALGGKFDPSLRYKIVNGSTEMILEPSQGSSASGASLVAGNDSFVAIPYQQWQISSDGDGYFRVANVSASASGVPNVLDDTGGATSAGSPIVQASATGSEEQEWDVVTAGGGYFNIVNRVSGLVLGINSGTGLADQQTPVSSTLSQEWQIVPVNSSAASPGFLIAANPPSVSIAQGAQGAAIITLTPIGGYAGTAAFACAGVPTNATCTFSPSTVTFSGNDTPQTTTVTIVTQASAAPALLRFTWRMRPWPSAFSLAALILLIAWLFFASRQQTSLAVRHHLALRVRLVLVVLAASCVFAAAGCGGGGSGSSGSGGGSTPPPPTATPLGTAVITVTASATAQGAGNANSSQSVGILVDVIQ
jgi:arabinogalactan endo-1,4-beta-galactosidase